MATAKQKAQYRADLSKYKKRHNVYVALSIITAIVSCLWVAAIAAIALYLSFTKLANIGLKQIYYVLSVLAICIGCAGVLILGIFIAVKVIQGLRYNEDSPALGVCGVIFAGIVPGVLYLATIAVDNSVEKPIDPVEIENERKKEREWAEARAKQEEKERKAREKEARDPRNYFTQDDDDVGEMPDINRVDFKDLKRVFEDKDE